ncbi:MAG: Asp23/Gls24 family envelope stress response protein [Lachnospiraceae bacterium]|jgi:uncharacterized alkaline shock family protein YloU|nr:Asp23/Gls24 family envelope stress response protein [Lachnospiraceae bacterium]MEE3460820.1 Asp23/Gls24 family envelope stress response protein [Lachnospiraceae bacterium]
MNGRMNTDMGGITINKDVIANYAGLATTECMGVVGMAVVNMRDGVTRLLKRENVDQGVVVSIHDNQIDIRLHIIVAYGVSIKAVAQNVLHNVKKRIEAFTGMEVAHISVMVDGVKIVDD